MSSQISEGAQQLYKYMRIRHIVCKGRKELEVFGIYDGVEGFSEKYRLYLDELLTAKIIRPHANCEIFILFRARLQPFVDLEKSEQSQGELVSRYKIAEQQILASLFRTFALMKQSGKLSDKAFHKELLYYSKFSIEVVMTSTQRYLHNSKQLGPSYFRGILRGVDKEKTASSPTTTSVSVSPNDQHVEEKDKAEWIRNQINQAEFSVLTPSEQEQYLSRLNQEYEDVSSRNHQTAT